MTYQNGAKASLARNSNCKIIIYDNSKLAAKTLLKQSIELLLNREKTYGCVMPFMVGGSRPSDHSNHESKSADRFFDARRCDMPGGVMEGRSKNMPTSHLPSPFLHLSIKLIILPHQELTFGTKHTPTNQ